MASPSSINFIIRWFNRQHVDLSQFLIPTYETLGKVFNEVYYPSYGTSDKKVTNFLQVCGQPIFIVDIGCCRSGLVLSHQLRNSIECSDITSRAYLLPLEMIQCFHFSNLIFWNHFLTKSHQTLRNIIYNNPLSTLDHHHDFFILLRNYKILLQPDLTMEDLDSLSTRME